MKYKIGDIVKVIKITAPNTYASEHLNMLGEITAIKEERIYPYEITFFKKKSTYELFLNQELRKATPEEIERYKQEVIENEI